MEFSVTSELNAPPQTIARILSVSSELNALLNAPTDARSSVCPLNSMHNHKRLHGAQRALRNCVPFTVRNHCTELSVPSEFNAPSQSMHAWSSACPLLHTPSETIARSSACPLNSMHRPSPCMHGAQHALCSIHRPKPLHGAQHLSSELNAPPQSMHARGSDVFCAPCAIPNDCTTELSGPTELNEPPQTKARSSAYVL